MALLFSREQIGNNARAQVDDHTLIILKMYYVDGRLVGVAGPNPSLDVLFQMLHLITNFVLMNSHIWDDPNEQKLSGRR